MLCVLLVESLGSIGKRVASKNCAIRLRFTQRVPVLPSLFLRPFAIFTSLKSLQLCELTTCELIKRIPAL